MDYCTLWPEGWWSHCCAAHDADYAAQVGQAVADGQLLSCVVQSLPAIAVDNPLLAGAAGVLSAAVGGVMWLGVRIFGKRFYNKAAPAAAMIEVQPVSEAKEPAWLEDARSFIGLREIKGQQHAPEIVQFWKDIKRGGIKDDETPWCAAFVGAMLERAGIRSSRFESAKSYLDWGQLLAMPVVGCVVVFTRQGGGHVGFAVGRDKAGNLLILGGNQSDAVNIKAFPVSRVSGYRWPDGIAVPAEPLPTLSGVDMTKGEA